MIFKDKDEYKKLSGIYKITQVSKDIVYIGQTSMTFIKRYWHHKWKLKDNSHDNKYLQNSWNKYGKHDFIFEVMHIAKENEDLNELEIRFIEEYNSQKNGFNLTTGGQGKNNCPMPEHAKKIVGIKNRKHNLGKKHSEYTKQKMSQSRKGRILSQKNKEKLIQSRLGSKHTEESKNKMRDSHLGSKNVVSVINENQAFEIKTRLINKERMIDISKSLSINYCIIRSILQCKVWNHVIVEGWEDFIEEYNKSKKKNLTNDEVQKIRKLLKEGYTAPKISKLCNVGESVVYGIKNNRTYKNVL